MNITKGLNTTVQTAEKLLQKSSTFYSPNVDGLKMINTRYYTKSPLNPKLELHQFINGENIHCEFSSKTFDNGDKFEIYKRPEEIIKVLKNKFGEIKAFKSSIEQHNNNPLHSYAKIKDAMSAKTHNFLA